MNKFLFLVLIIYYLCPKQFYSQVVQEWEAHYVGLWGADALSSMVIDQIGNVYVTGSSNNTINSFDYATVKYSASGVQLWSARYGGQQNRGAIAYSIAADRFGNAYVTGGAPVSSSGPTKFATIKYNQLGEQSWLRIFYGQFYQAGDNGTSIVTDYNSNVYVTGISFSTNSGCDYTTLKYDSSGTLKWSTYYDGSTSYDYAYHLKVDNYCNVYVTGCSWNDSTFYDIATVKYDSTGIEQWAERYNGPGNGGDSAMGLFVDNNGNVYVTGRSWGGESTGFDYVTIKYNSSGAQQWARRYNRANNWTDIPHSLAVDDSGNAYVTGETHYSNGSQYATIKYSPSGEQLWVALYNYQNGEHGYALALDKYGGIYVTGESWGGLFGTRYDFATVKYSAAGVQQWVIRTSGSVDEVPGHIAVDTLGNVYVAGNDGHYHTIKYNQITGVEPVSNELPTEFKLYQNYPNPFNPQTIIRFDIASKSNVTLKIFNMLGQEIRTLINSEVTPREKSVVWDGKNNFGTIVNSGIYVYELRAGDFRNSKKMVFIK